MLYISYYIRQDGRFDMILAATRILFSPAYWQDKIIDKAKSDLRNNAEYWSSSTAFEN